ncbi:MAG: hypothetical protein JWR38_5301 [Mucilaginibacter sp.]|nr:hypothetical protein [Mucilaginibacter sp.]
MKKLLFALLTLTCVKAFAQDAKAQYLEDLNYLGCKITAYTLPDTQQRSFLTSYPCDGTQDVTGMQDYLKKRGMSVNAQLLDEIQQLNREFKPLRSNEFISSFLTNGIFNDQRYQKIHAFYVKHSTDPGFNGLIQDIRQKISGLVPPQQGDSSQRPRTVNTAAAADTPRYAGSRPVLAGTSPRDNEAEKGWFEGVKFELDVFSILFTLFIGIAVLAVRRKRGSAEIPEKFRNYVQEKLSRHAFENAGRNPTERLEKELRELSNLVEEHRRQLRELSIRDSTPPVMSEARNWLSDITPVIMPKEAPSEIVYLPTPSEDSSFDNSFASPVYREGISIYKVTKKGDNRAIFQIDEHVTAVKLALQYVELRIEPCCIPLNAYNSQSQRIELVKPGELELKENRWVILSKMEIRYEN